MIFIKPPPRGTDAQGSGDFGAPRGKDKNGKPRKHKGFDYRVKPGSRVYSPFYGFVTKIGYPYSWDLSFRYIEIEQVNGDRIRYFYVLPSVTKGEFVYEGDLLGTSQRLPYEGIRQHVHVEVRKMVNTRRKLVDPEKYFEEYWA